MLGPFYTKSRDLNCGLSFPSNSWYWHVGLWKVAIIINWEFFHWLLFSVLLSPEKSLMARTDHRVLARSNKSSMNFWKLTNVKSAGLWTVKTNVLFTHVYDFFGRLGTIEDVLIKRFKIDIKNIDTNMFLFVLLTRINFFLWFSSSMSSISSRSMSTSFGNSVCDKKYFSKQNKIISVNTALN